MVGLISPSGSKKCGKMPSQYLACTQPLLTALSSCVCLACEKKVGLPHQSSTSRRDPRFPQERADVARIKTQCRIACGAAAPAMAHPNPDPTWSVAQRRECTGELRGSIHMHRRVGWAQRTTSAPSRRSAGAAPPRTRLAAAAALSRASSSQRSPDGRVRTRARPSSAPPSSPRSPCRPALRVSARSGAGARRDRGVNTEPGRGACRVRLACWSPAVPLSAGAEFCASG